MVIERRVTKENNEGGPVSQNENLQSNIKIALYFLLKSSDSKKKIFIYFLWKTLLNNCFPLLYMFSM